MGDRARLLRPTAILLIALALASALAAATLDRRTLGLLINTLRLAGLTCIFSVPVGSVVAFVLGRTDLPLRKWAILLFGLMLFVPLYLQAAAWQAGFGLQGWYTLAIGGPVWLRGWTAVVWIHSLASLPWVVLIAGAGFRLVERELEEQALLDAAPPKVFWRVTVPAAAGSIGLAALWVMVLTAGEMTVTDLFAVRTYAEEIYTQFAVARELGDAPLGVGSGMLLTAWLVAAGWVFVAATAPRERLLSLPEAYVYRLGRWKWIALAAVAVVLAVVVGVPLANLVYKAGVIVVQVDDIRVRTWSLVRAVIMVAGNPWRFQRELGWSLGLGGLAASAAVLAAVAASWWARGRRWRTAALVVATATCLAVPGPVVGLAIIWMLNRPELPALAWLYNQSILAPWLALTVRTFPVAVLIVWHALASMPREMLDAAAVDGAGAWTQLWRIALPCRAAVIVVAWLVAMALALGELAASVLVTPAGVTTLSIAIFGLLHYGVEDQVAGLCLALAALLAATAAGVLLVGRRWRRSIMAS